MLNAATQREAATTVQSAGKAAPVLWLPPIRMRNYQIAKTLVGLIAVAIFAGWLWLQWSNGFMRIFAGALIVLTGWITYVSVRNDRVRSRGRQLTALPGRLIVTRTDDEPATIRLSEIAYARWRDDDDKQAGLWFFDRNENRICRLDLDFLGDEAEARSFVGWLREHSGVRFDVKWPDRF